MVIKESIAERFARCEKRRPAKSPGKRPIMLCCFFLINLQSEAGDDWLSQSGNPAAQQGTGSPALVRKELNSV